MKDNWRKIKLDDLGRHYGGLTNKSKDNFGKGKPYIPYLNIYTNGRIDVDNLELVEIFSSESQNKVQKGDLFFTTSSETPHEVGMTSVLLDDIGEAYLNSFCFGFRLDNFEELLPEFAVHLFRGKEVRKTISDLAQGSTRYNLSKSIFFNKLYLNLPPLPLQQKIAKILSTVDNVIEKTESAIAKYQAIKQGLMHDLFTRGIDVNTGKLRPTPQEAPELYKESDLGLIPRDWEEIIFGDEINFLSGFPFASAFFNEEKRGKPLIRIRDLLNSSQETYYNGAYSDSYLIKEGDVLIGMDGDFHIVKWKNSPSLLNQRILKISEKKDGKLYLDYFFYYLFPFLLDVHNRTAATTVKHLSTKDISGTTRFMPLKSEQILSAKKILSIDDKIQTEQQALAKYQQLKAGLLQDLLTGKVEVSVD